ncbi:MAG: hypothetical protein SF187_29895 [Deltaproteobacteria bacterium]|nr:hypothetical protein [Deltaproteobacteria bacterium]
MPKTMESWVAKEWRALGFYFYRDTVCREYRFVGSREGLRQFGALLMAYGLNPNNADESEHEHHDPFGSLKIMTLTFPRIDDDAISGTLDDLRRWASIVSEKLDVAVVGEKIRISEEYTRSSQYILILDVREDGFDPAAAEA